MADAPPAAFAFTPTLHAFLAAWRTASLATLDDHGDPHNCNVQFAQGIAPKPAPDSATDPAPDAPPERGGCEVWWVSSPTSAHSQHLAARPRAAITVYAHTDSPEVIHGMQARGTVQPGLTPDDAGYAAALELYAAKFPFVRQPPFRDALAKQALYRFRPDWIRWIDNRRGFGWKVEHTFHP